MNTIPFIILMALLTSPSSSTSAQGVVTDIGRVEGGLITGEEIKSHNVVPDKGIIPDETTAIRVAKAILEPIYGVEKISSQEPFVAKLSKDTWIITGTFHRDNDTPMLGGTAYIEIARADGRVLRITHGM